MNERNLLLSIVFAAATTCATECQAESAKDYPSHSIKIIVPFAAGGTTDTLPRLVAEKLRQKWDQPVIIENRSGAGGNIGAAAVASSPPDGYTLLTTPPGPVAINQFLYGKLPFEPTDLVPITLLASMPNVLDVRLDFPARTVQEFIAYTKAHPGKVTFASQGSGSTSHLATVWFERLTGTDMIHVPYRGTAPALQDIMGGTVDVFFGNLGTSTALHLGGKLRILGVCGNERVPSLADIPTMRESGVPGFVSTTWYVLMAPKGTPGDIIDKLNSAVTEILKEPDVQTQLVNLGVRPEPMDVPSTAKFIEDERARWGEMIKADNITLE